MTQTQLLDALDTYLAEMRRCEAAQCYWALVHLLMIMPDVCAALESVDGRTSEKRYRAWCESFFDCTLFNGIERYKLRCALLHQGQAQPDTSHLKPGETLRYDRFSFAPAGLLPDLQAKDGLLHVNVNALHAETVRAITVWAAQMERDQNVSVAEHLADLAKTHPVQVEISVAPPIIETAYRQLMPGAFGSPIGNTHIITQYVTK
jgi:hypothetical protein